MGLYPTGEKGSVETCSDRATALSFPHHLGFHTCAIPLHTEAEVPLILKTVSFLLSADPKIMLAAAAGSSLAPAIPPCSAGCSGICVVADRQHGMGEVKEEADLTLHA